MFIHAWYFRLDSGEICFHFSPLFFFCCFFFTYGWAKKRKLRKRYAGIIFVSFYAEFILPLTIQLIINDLLGGRGWWLVKGALVRGPFLFLEYLITLNYMKRPEFFPAFVFFIFLSSNLFWTTTHPFFVLLSPVASLHL